VTVERADAVVVGGGIVGAAVAYHLARLRLGRVVAVEARTPAAGATGRAAGIVSEQLWDRWDVEVVRESKREYAALADSAAPGAYRTNGFVRWTADPKVAEALAVRVAELRAWGVEMRSLETDELARRLPAIRTDGLVGIAFAPNDGVVAPSGLAEAYVAEGRRLGVEWTLGVGAERLAPEDAGWTVRAGGSSIRARIAVVAAGAWSKRLLAASGHPLPLAPYRTQAAVLSVPGGVAENVPSFDDLDTNVYGRPEEHGRLLAGNGTENAEADPDRFATTGDETFVAHLAESFDQRLPGWSEAGLVRAWAGVCVGTPDRRPLIGEVPGAAGLFVITGFNGFGVMRAGGAAARLAAAIVEPGPASAARLASVRPDRFTGPGAPFLAREGFTLEGGADPAF
jgi:sarcosine oxidase, subunit beta